MESITELLESLPQHFGGVAPTQAAATDAECMVVDLGNAARALALAGYGGMGSSNASLSGGLDR